MDNSELSFFQQSLKDYVEDENPTWYKQMVREGTLMQFLQEREERALRQISDLVNRGLNRSEATEMIWLEFMSLPSDE